ncbi:hypothetical protein HYY74_07220 [Candidatus Woesearchaeota archaeon]|nr:hypothetical protein [Candidatus Woesearchaeota archaeon]
MAKTKIRFPLIPARLDFSDKRQGFWALLGGLILAGLGSLTMPSIFSPGAWVNAVIVLGVIVGVINAFNKEALTFLITALSATFMLSVLASSQAFPYAVMQLFSSVSYLLAAASVVVSLKVVYALTR